MTEHRLHPSATGPERPTCSCGAEAVRNGMTKPRADGSQTQYWTCPRRKQTPSARRAHADAQARYARTEEGAYRELRRSLRKRIRYTERRIAEVEGSITLQGDGASPAPGEPRLT